MTTPTRPRRAKATPPPEAGAAPTEMHTDPPQLHAVPPAEPEALQGEVIADAPFSQPVQPESAQMATSAVLTGPEQAELRARNDTVDWARERAQALQEEAVKHQRLADMGQSDIYGLIRVMLEKYQLDPAYGYRVNLERGILEPTGPNPNRVPQEG